MTRCGNHQEIVVHFESGLTLNDSFDSEPPGAIVSMHNSVGAELVGKSLVVSYIVTVR
jgi:hypothetical protein